MNREQLRDAVYDRLGVDSTDARLTPTRINRFIDAANLWIATDHDWPWLQASTSFSTVASTGDYTVPTDWLRTRYLRINTYQSLEHLEFGDLEDRWPDSAVTSVPWAYSIETDRIYLRPIPDGVYTVVHKYQKREPGLTADDQSPLMPALFHDAIAEAATYLSLRSSRDDPRAGGALQAYQEWRARMLDDRRRATGPLRVKVRPGGAFGD